MNGWFHLLSNHRFMLSMFGGGSVFTGRKGMLACSCLSLASLRRKYVCFFVKTSQIQTVSSLRILSFTPNFIFFPNASLICSFYFQIVQTFPALKPVGKGSLLSYLFPINRPLKELPAFIWLRSTLLKSHLQPLCAHSPLTYVKVSVEWNCHTILCFSYVKKFNHELNFPLAFTQIFSLLR